MIPKKTESKFQRFAEVLPSNARTAVILKEREEIRLAKEATEKQVSSSLLLLQQFRLYSMLTLANRFFFPVSYS